MTAPNNELVVILHGIGMSSLRMVFLEHGLKKAGYKTLNLNYPSRSRTIEQCADHVQKSIEAANPSSYHKLHFAAHSMGTLVALDLLARKAFTNAASAVLIAPPYKGSEMADFLDGTIGPVYRWLYGPAGQQLKTGYRAPLTFDAPEGIAIGIIAGTSNLLYPHAWFAMRHAGVHDGLVAVKNTKILGDKNHITIRRSHSMLIESSIGEVVHFLGHGRFKSAPAGP